jgi:hypothetical protein
MVTVLQNVIEVVSWTQVIAKDVKVNAVYSRYDVIFCLL